MPTISKKQISNLSQTETDEMLSTLLQRQKVIEKRVMTLQSELDALDAAIASLEKLRVAQERNE